MQIPSEDRILHFFCNHVATPAQVALAQSIGFDDVTNHPVVFGENPERDVCRFTPSNIIAVVAPTHIIVELLRIGYTIVEFENLSSRRRYFLCSGAWVITLHTTEYVKSPIPLAEQEETLIREKRKQKRRR